MHRSPISLSALLVVSALSATALTGPAQAQHLNTELMAKCSQVVGKMKFEGWAADRNKEMMMLSCESHGGSIPGAVEEKPVSLTHRQPAKRN